MEDNNNNNYNNPNIVLAERNRLRALEREARIRRFALEQRRQRQEEDVMDQPPGARALQATETDRLGYCGDAFVLVFKTSRTEDGMRRREETTSALQIFPNESRRMTNLRSAEYACPT